MGRGGREREGRNARVVSHPECERTGQEEKEEEEGPTRIA